MEEFKIGDRVSYFITPKDNISGVILSITLDNQGEQSMLGINFDEYRVYMHTLNGLCKHGHGYWCSKDICVLKNPKNKYIVDMKV